MKTEKLNFAEMKNRIKEHLQMALNIDDFSINFAKQDGDVWKVNVEFHWSSVKEFCSMNYLKKDCRITRF
nr:MAG: hypothetical protein OI716_00375 [Candidatus Methanoperedens sp.]